MGAKRVCSGSDVGDDLACIPLRQSRLIACFSRYDEMDCNAGEPDLGIVDPFLTDGSVYYGIMDEAVSHIFRSSWTTEHVNQTDLSRP